MENLEYQAQKAIVRALKMFSKASILTEGIIKSVDETNFTCVITVGNSEVEYSKVPLKVLIGSQASIIEIPKVGTNCLLKFKDNSLQRPQLESVHEISKYKWLIGEQILEVTTDGFVFNKGEKGSMLTETTIDKINTIENDINDLKTAFTNWVVVPTDGGSALKAITATWYGSQIPMTKKTDVTNDKIKQ